MPNKCTVCGKIHPDDAPYLMKGCDVCGNKFFFYIKEEDLKKAEKEIKRLTKKEIKEIENDIREIIPETKKTKESIILDIEAIRVIRPGKYKIDVTTLFSQRPVVIRIGEGRYEIDLSTIQAKIRKNKS